MKRLAARRQRIDLWRGLETRARDLTELVALAADEPDESLAADIDRDATALESELGRLEFELAFSGPYDDRSAIIAIHAGAGGTESQDWAEMLLRMYLRWC